ncbi:peptidase C13 family-domain-containing protein [Cantharellus anzutake]|uniref:peptidase C13 family-domain-containing protein n=1 Tax=Cantharellus anzutake TaxID=1750568 RepID=UPI001907DA72|nr:peptidase C13 family-domain-containing protein [Cantharellus anzutake]KAF8342612.1 peptidase C13 family-domain-containing protein [Cantharellus anzutake]
MRLSKAASLLSLLCLALWGFVGSFASNENKTRSVEDFFSSSQQSGHTNNWAVLVCSSRYWFNYRHIANALGIYRTVKRLGIPDSNIILMLADDIACNKRNKYPATVFANPGRILDLYGDNIEVDYRGYEVTVENFIRLLTGRVDESMPRSKRLLTDERSNIIIYMAGHGGVEFLKFQDNEEISAFDLADAFEQMWQKKRYREIFFMVDTCQAVSMYSKFYSPNILATGSSQVGESSYSYENDDEIGVSVIDSYTHFVLEYLEGINKTSQATMEDFFAMYDPIGMKSSPGIRKDLFTSRPLNQTLITDFFGGVAQAQLLDDYTYENIDRIRGSISGVDENHSYARSHSHLDSKPSGVAHHQPTLTESPNDPALVDKTTAAFPPRGIRKESSEKYIRVWLTIISLGALCLFTVWPSTSRTTPKRTPVHQP